MPPPRKKRCPNGTRFNKTSKNVNKCDPFNSSRKACEYTENRKRCQRSTRCNIRTGKCDTTTHALRMKRCPTGHRRNRSTKQCDKYTNNVPRRETETEGEEESEGKEEEDPTADDWGELAERLREQTPSHHSKPPSHHSKPPSHHSKSPSHHSKSPSHHSNMISRQTLKERAANKLKKITEQMRNKDIMGQKKAKFINSICSDSGVCIAFGGRNAKVIKHFFKDFIGFDYMDSISPIGEKSANGFLYSLKYVREAYVSHAVLKSSRKAHADNLMYEYGVGLEINKLFYDKYPIFVETYKCYSYDSEESWRIFGNPSLIQYLMSQNSKLEQYIAYWSRMISEGRGNVEESKQNVKNFKEALEKTKLELIKTNKLVLELSPPSAKKFKEVLVPYEKIDYERSCTDSKVICLLVQHIDKAPTLFQEFGTMKISEVLNVLYQIYFTLSAISITYTHYDLHANNVLLYTPVRDKFIQYHYHTKEGDVISFKSCYIVKIIDYGRCFVKPFSEEAEKEVCDTNECAPKCGSEFGYFFDDKFKTYFIKSSIKNESHDLRLLKFLGLLISDEHKRNGNVSDVHRWLDRYLFKKANYTHEFGTPEKLETGLKTHKGGARTVEINNVTDASTLLQELLLKHRAENEQTHAAQTKLGDLHVYCDGRNMEYTQAA
jgi:hypothetical protein